MFYKFTIGLELHRRKRYRRITFLSVSFSSRLLGRVPTLGRISKLVFLSFFFFLQWKGNGDKVQEGDFTREAHFRWCNFPTRVPTSSWFTYLIRSNNFSLVLSFPAVENTVLAIWSKLIDGEKHYIVIIIIWTNDPAHQCRYLWIPFSSLIQ